MKREKKLVLLYEISFFFKAFFLASYIQLFPLPRELSCFASFVVVLFIDPLP
jgi:hypothetical protein